MGRAGNKNALKHGLYAKRKVGAQRDAPREIANINATIIRLEDALALIETRMAQADADHFAALANALATNSVALFTGHRTLAIVTGNYTPIEDALAELQGLEFHAD
jgi:hypothetical protein